MRQQAIHDWLRARPFVVDTALVLPLLLLGLAGVRDGFTSPHALANLGLLLPLIWRRRFPIAVFTVVSITCAFQAVVVRDVLFGDVGFLMALYSVNVYATRPWVRPASLAVGLLGAVVAPVALSGLGPVEAVEAWRGYPRRFLLMAGIVAASSAFAWTLGGLLRTRRAYVRQLEERARRLEYERDQQARLARSAERARIAGELHDVVAHSLSVVVAQSDGGRYAAEQDPEAARRALNTIGTTSRQALAEMRRLLGVLRTEEHAPAEPPDGTSPEKPTEEPTGTPIQPEPEGSAPAPQPGIGEVENLIQRMRDCGLAVELDLGVDPTRLPSGAGLVAYRVVQEALTNVLKHGGPAVHARARLAVQAGILEVEVADDGRGAAATTPDQRTTPTDTSAGVGFTGDGRGHGLVGMRERVAVYGGSLSAGPRTGGGFQVVARIPLTEGEQV